MNESTEHAARPPVIGWKRDVILTLDRWIYRFAKRWLAIFNLGVAVYVLLPFLAPVLMVGSASQAGPQIAPRIAHAIYTVYRPACHQLPERSLFLFGPQRVYSLQELRAAGLIAEQDGPLERQRFLGAPGMGFKVPLCQRDLALYGSIVAIGLVFGLVRKRLRPLRLWAFGLMLLPMAVDGGSQLLMLRESNWVLRIVTGVLTGAACVWLLYPHLEEAFGDLRRQANQRVHLEPKA